MTVADELAGVASAVYWTDRGAVAVAKGLGKAGGWGYSKAQNAGMRWQNWRHRGAGEDDAVVTTAAPVVASQAAAKKGTGKSWTTDEESFENTTTSHTTYTRKRTR